MKKLLLVAALGAVGLLSAKDAKIKKTGINKNPVIRVITIQNPQKQIKALLGDIQWIRVSTWCGKVFYLDANDYSNYDELDAASTYFTNQQCAGASTFTSQFT